jgi:hypothetical protein
MLITSGLAKQFQKYLDFAADALALIAPRVCAAVIDGAETEELEEALELRKKDAFNLQVPAFAK